MTPIDDPLLVALWTCLWRNHCGRERAIKAADLCEQFAISNGALIEATRRLNIEHHRPVCSCQEGIFAARTPREVAQYKADLRRRSLGTFERMAAMDDILREFEGQKELDFDHVAQPPPAEKCSTGALACDEKTAPAEGGWAT